MGYFLKNLDINVPSSTPVILFTFSAMEYNSVQEIIIATMYVIGIGIEKVFFAPSNMRIEVK
jgi:hypothetical protein